MRDISGPAYQLWLKLRLIEVLLMVRGICIIHQQKPTQISSQLSGIHKVLIKNWQVRCHAKFPARRAVDTTKTSKKGHTRTPFGHRSTSLVHKVWTKTRTRISVLIFQTRIDAKRSQKTRSWCTVVSQCLVISQGLMVSDSVSGLARSVRVCMARAAVLSCGLYDIDQSRYWLNTLTWDIDLRWKWPKLSVSNCLCWTDNTK